MSVPNTALLDALLAGLSDRNAASCILRKAQQAAYAPEQYVKSVRTSLFPTYIDVNSTVKPSELWEVCGLSVPSVTEESPVSAKTSYLDPRTKLVEIIAAQKVQLENTAPPTNYKYADEKDYYLLHDSIRDFLSSVDSITNNTELKELAFNLTIGTTAPPPSFVASLQDARSKLNRLEKLKETLSKYRTAAADLEAVLECVPRIEAIKTPLPDFGALKYLT